MSGRKDSQLKTDKAVEIIRRLRRNPGFNEDVRKLRSIFTTGSIPEYLLRREILLEKYHILISSRVREVFDKFLLGLDIDRKDYVSEHFPIKIEIPSESESKKRGRAFVKLLIYDGISEGETRNYIVKKWNLIQRALRIQGLPKPPRIRRLKNSILVEEIIKLKHLSTKKMKEKLESKGFKNIKTKYIQTILNRYK